MMDNGSITRPPEKQQQDSAEEEEEDQLHVDTSAVQISPGNGPDAPMEDLALSPILDDHGTSSLIPRAITESSNGMRALPSLTTPATYRDVPFLMAFFLHLCVALMATNAIRDSELEQIQEGMMENNAAGSAMDSASRVGNHSQSHDASSLAQHHPAESIGSSLQYLVVINALFAVGWCLTFIYTPKVRFLQVSWVLSTIGLFLWAISMLLHVSGDAKLLGILLCIVVLLDLRWIHARKSGFDFVSVLFDMVVDFLYLHFSLSYVTCAIVVVYSIWAGWICSTIAFVGDNNVSPWSFNMLLICFHFYWTSNVFKHVLTVVVSGATLMWYYKDEMREKEENARQSDHEGVSTREISEKTIVWHYVRCALSTSFGSICIGSLLCPIAHILWSLLRWSKRENSMLVRRLFANRSDLMQQFISTYHKYSFVHVAGYGKSFYAAAQDAWDLIETRGIEAIVDDDLTSRLLLMGANGWAGVMSALCSSAFAFTGHSVFFALAAFFVTYTTLSIATQVVLAMVKTLFVCFAENPARLSQLNSLIYHRLVRLSELKSFSDHKLTMPSR